MFTNVRIQNAKEKQHKALQFGKAEIEQSLPLWHYIFSYPAVFYMPYKCKETREMSGAELSPGRTQSVPHPLHGHSDSGCSGLLPVPAVFQASGRCSALEVPLSS